MMISIVRTNSENAGFVELVRHLDIDPAWDEAIHFCCKSNYKGIDYGGKPARMFETKKA